MVEPRFRWTFADEHAPSEAAAAVAAARGISTRLAGLLAARGAVTAEELIAWFADPLEGLHDPAALPDAASVLLRVRAARDRGERVLVFGDFDADGLTGLAIMTLALRRFGVAVEPYVPSRLDEGHGLSMAALDAAVAFGASLIITVDCGTTSVAEVAESNARGIDVIITDHHRVPPVLPAAFAIVNPHRPDSIYPDRRLAGSGVAFKVAQLILADEPGGPAAALEFTDLATIGSVADVAPVVGENRAIARLGLERMRRAPRPGIAALLERARIAAGRGRPGDGLVRDRPAAQRRRSGGGGPRGRPAPAGRRSRRGGDPRRRPRGGQPDPPRPHEDGRRRSTGGGRRRVRRDRPRSCAARGASGSSGLVAARLVEDRGRPAVVGADLGDVVRASCRSDGSLDLGATLERCSDLFIRFGGHAGAAGFEIATDRWDEFRARFLALAAESVPPDPRLALAVEMALPALEVDYALYRELAGLAPCGPGNADPLVAVLGLTVTRVRAASGGHSQLTLRRGLDVLDGIAFGRSDIAEVVREGDRLDVVARLTSRTFGGFESLQLDIRDVATSGSHPRAAAVLAARGDAALLAGIAS